MHTGVLRCSFSIDKIMKLKYYHEILKELRQLSNSCINKLHENSNLGKIEHCPKIFLREVKIGLPDLRENFVNRKKKMKKHEETRNFVEM